MKNYLITSKRKTFFKTRASAQSHSPSTKIMLSGLFQIDLKLTPHSSLYVSAIPTSNNSWLIEIRAQWKGGKKNKIKKKTCLRSSLYHSNSALGTAEASHCRIPFCPTAMPVFLALEIKGGSVKQSKISFQVAFHAHKNNIKFSLFISPSKNFLGCFSIIMSNLLPESMIFFFSGPYSWRWLALSWRRGSRCR